MKRFRIKNIRYVVCLYKGAYMGRINPNSSGVSPYSIETSIRFAKKYNLTAATLALKFVRNGRWPLAFLMRADKATVHEVMDS
jgi:hypothetical protein